MLHLYLDKFIFFIEILNKYPRQPVAARTTQLIAVHSQFVFPQHLTHFQPKPPVAGLPSCYMAEIRS